MLPVHWGRRWQLPCWPNYKPVAHRINATFLQVLSPQEDQTQTHAKTCVDPSLHDHTLPSEEKLLEIWTACHGRERMGLAMQGDLAL